MVLGVFFFVYYVVARVIRLVVKVLSGFACYMMFWVVACSGWLWGCFFIKGIGFVQTSWF